MRPTEVDRRAGRWDLLGLTVVAGLLFFISLGARDLWNPNEPIYGRAVAEMAARGDWLIPSVNDKVFAEKPILYYWGALAASKLLGGVDELALRVPCAVAGVISVLLTYLLVLPYVGRRRALLAATLFMTLYQVFWAARSVQMDVLVLAATLGVVVPMSRLIDFDARPGRAYALAGLAAGLGFAGKGPVVWIVAGIVVVGYAASARRLDVLFRREILIGAAAAVSVNAPWYLMLWLGGEGAFLYEVLVRQNFTRFVDAWDHRQPWWYYLEYLWVDYLPWAWLLPAAVWMRSRSEPEARLHRMSWIWIVGVVFFFSLSESKRAPYILPIAPAIAVLAAGVVERWWSWAWLEHGARRAAVVSFSALAALLTLAGALALAAPFEIPPALTGVASVLGVLLAATGLALGSGVVFARRRPSLAPMALLAGLGAIYLVAAVWALPLANAQKSARGFATEMNRQVAAGGGTLASYSFWDWRAGYSYYADRSIRDLESRESLEAFWRAEAAPYVLVEGDRDEAELRSVLPQAEIVHQGVIGSRKASLFAKPAAGVSPPAADPGSEPNGQGRGAQP